MNSIFETDEGEKRRVAIYIRVSTVEQKIEGHSTEAQRKKLLEYVKNNEQLNLVTNEKWIYEDTHTGSDINRKGLQLLLTHVKEGKYDAVLVWKIDRLSRSLKHLLNLFEQFKENKVSFISLQENIDFKGAIGSLIFQVFGAIAQFERELIKGRTLMGKIASADSGNWTGTYIPFGYDKVPNPNGKGSRLVLNTEEKKWVEQIYEWYIYEGLGDLKISKKLNELKVPKKNHKLNYRTNTKWTTNMVESILKLPLYRGSHVANKKDEEGNLLPEDQWTIVDIPPCVSDFTFEQAQNARDGRTGGATETHYLLSGKLIDMDLDPPKKFTGAPRYKGGFSYRRKQFDKDGVHYPVFEIPGKQIEKYVWDKVLEALQEPEVFIQHYLSMEYADPSLIDKIGNELSQLRERKAKLELEMARAESAFESGIYSEEKVATKITEKNEEIANVEKLMQERHDRLAMMTSVDVEVKKLKEASEQVKYRLDNLDRKQKKILCNLFVESVEMRRKEVPSNTKRKKWNIRATIKFRFNLDKLREEAKKGRTKTAPTKAKAEALAGKKSNDGGPGWS